MKEKVLNAAYAGLLHDIGKFVQRTGISNDLTDEELSFTAVDQTNGSHMFIHSGYTARFIKDVAGIDNEFRSLVSGHHLKADDQLSYILSRADVIASGIDSIDELKDEQSIYQSGNFIRKRMSSVYSEVDFGRKKETAYFNLNSLSAVQKPVKELSSKDLNECASDYRELYEKMLSDIRSNPDFKAGMINQTNYDILYANIQEYCSLIPSSTYQTDQIFVSLFDHLKLTSAIASCLALTEGNEEFLMLEFDISGIQKFIYKIVEGSESKSGIAKALRGRSFFVNMICSYITYSFLHEFDLTQANIIFNTGGGALLMLPGGEEARKKVDEKAEQLCAELYQMFGTSITFVYAFETCDAQELETFKTDKQINLKGKLEKAKSSKFRSLLDDDFYYSQSDCHEVCRLCGYNLVEKETDICPVCASIEKVAEFMVKNESFFINYHFNEKYDGAMIFGNDSVTLSTKPDQDYDYIDSVNRHEMGNVRYIACLVPKNKGRVLSFSEITDNLLPAEDKGDRKLAVLKMDVDNLGAVFAYGMDAETRSLSKYQNLSRMTENFFSIRLGKICRKVSEEMNPSVKTVADNGTMFYINYAGGDDLVILGPAKAVLRLAQEIRKEFAEYVNNDNITLSAGIHIQKPKSPIRYGIPEAERMLESAKQADGKNSIGILDTVMNYSEYINVLNESEYYQELIENESLSRSVLYQYMKQLDNCEDYDSYLSKIPVILYSITRNVNDKETVNELKKKVLSSENIHEVNLKTLAMKLAVMESRDNNGE